MGVCDFIMLKLSICANRIGVRFVVSGDAIIQASATVVVGMIFLVTLRKALDLHTTASDLRPLWLAALLFFGACYASFFMENTTFTAEARWWFGVLAMTFFNVGLLVVAFAVYNIVKEKSDQEQASKERAQHTLRLQGVLPEKHMKLCLSCGKSIPLASETCDFCNAKQPER
jgi:hypothetical protein